MAFVPYYTPGSEELARACAQALSRGECAILQNHGVVTIGSTFQEAFNRFVTLEYLARSIINATQIRSTPIPLKESVLSTRNRSNATSLFLLPIKHCPHEHCCCAKRHISGKEKEIRAELCTLVKRAYDQELFTASSGALSIRTQMSTTFNMYDSSRSGTSFLITPAQRDRSSVSLDEICYLSDRADCTMNTCDGRISPASQGCHFHPSPSRGDRDSIITPSQSAEIHDKIYKIHPEINCIIIAQPKYATSFCITGSPFNSAQIPESYLVLGDVHYLPFESLHNAGDAIARILNPSAGITTVLVGGFGLISIGINPLKTFVQVEVCESMCGVFLEASRRGPIVELSSDQLKEIDHCFKNGH